MTQQTVYVFQPFIAAKKGNRVLIGQPMQVPSEEFARRVLARSVNSPTSGVVGGVVISTIADSDTGECGSTMILAREGEIPPHFLDRLEH